MITKFYERDKLIKDTNVETNDLQVFCEIEIDSVIYDINKISFGFEINGEFVKKVKLNKKVSFKENEVSGVCGD